MSGIEENGDFEGLPEGVIGAITKAVDFKRLYVLDKAFVLGETEPSADDMQELLELLQARRAQLDVEITAYPPKMSGSGHESFCPTGVQLRYDLGLTRLKEAMVATALKHGRESEEALKAKDAIHAHVVRRSTHRGF